MSIPARVRGQMDWNPLACSGTWMRPNALLMAKLSWLLLALGGYWQYFSGPFAPSVGLLSVIPGVRTLMTLAFWLSGLFLLFNRGVRTAAVVAGAVALLMPFESLAAWRPSAWVCGCVLTLCALHGPGEKPHFVRAFIVLVHVAALLGATGGPGWVGMALGTPWSDGDFVGTIPRWFASRLAPDALAGFLHGTTLVVFTLVVPGLLIPRLRLAAAWTALAFYTSLYLALGNREVALFAGAVAVGQIAFLDWPRRMVVLWPRACGWPLWLRIALDRYDFDHRTDWPRPPDPDANLETWFDGNRNTGAWAIVHLTLFLPAFHFVLLALLGSIHFALPAYIGVPMNTGIAAALLGFSAYAGLTARRARRRHSGRSVSPRETIDEPATSEPSPEAEPGQRRS